MSTPPTLLMGYGTVYVLIQSRVTAGVRCYMQRSCEGDDDQLIQSPGVATRRLIAD